MTTYKVYHLLWLVLLFLCGNEVCRANNHSERTNRILGRLTTFLTTSTDTTAKRRLLDLLMQVGESSNTSNSQNVTKNAKGPTDKRISTGINEEDLDPPIEDLLAQASEYGADYAEPELLIDSAVVIFDRDIVMPVDQFAVLQRNVTLDLFDEALEKLTAGKQQNSTIINWIKSKIKKTRGRRAARRDRRRYWPNAEVPIRIASRGFSRSDKRRIASSLNQITAKTCVCFRILGRGDSLRNIPHIRIVDGNGCRSFVGYSVRNQDGTLSQDLTLNRRCRKPRIVVHEVLHALGLFHEQSRPDRDAYVDIQVENIRPGSVRNFKRFGFRTIDPRGIEYDYTSIMHYSNRAFSRNGGFTIVPKPYNKRRQFLHRIGRSQQMSTGDAEAIKKMYECSETEPWPTCYNYPYVFP